MATLLRIGQHVINLDQVTHIDNLLPSVTVWFGERSTRFNGSDATQRHSWLAQHAQLISAPTPGTAADTATASGVARLRQPVHEPIQPPLMVFTDEVPHTDKTTT